MGCNNDVLCPKVMVHVCSTHTVLCNFFMLKRSEQFFGVKMSMEFTNLKEK